jgi:hypothetical protein
VETNQRDGKDSCRQEPAFELFRRNEGKTSRVISSQIGEEEHTQGDASGARVLRHVDGCTASELERKPAPLAHVSLDVLETLGVSMIANDSDELQERYQSPLEGTQTHRGVVSTSKKVFFEQARRVQI